MKLTKHNTFRTLLLTLLLLFMGSIQNNFAQDEQTDIHYYWEQFSQEKANNDSLNMSRSLYKIGKLYTILSKHDSAEVVLKQAILLTKKLENRKAEVIITNYLATNFSDLSLHDTALFYYKSALQAAYLLADSNLISKVLLNMGDEYASAGKYLLAANSEIESLRIKELIQDSSNLAYFYQKIGEVFKQADEKEKWEEYITKAYTLIRNPEYTSVRATAAVYNDLGGIAESNGEFELALCYYDTLNQIGFDENYDRAIRVANSNRATIYKLQGKNHKALEAAELSNLHDHTPEGYSKISFLNLLAELYFEDSNLTTAEEFAEQAIEMGKSYTFPDEQMRSSKIMYLIAKENGNYESALKWIELYRAQYDTLRKSEIASKINELEIAYETEKSEQKIIQLTTESQLNNQKIALFLAISIALILAVIVILFNARRRKKEGIQREEQLKQKLLRSQMNPHFLFNALGSIQNYMYKNETRKAAGFLNNFAALTRSILEQSSEELIPLSDEIETLRNYLKLEQMRMQESFSFQIIEEDLEDAEFTSIPPMLIQPFVENAIKHGLSNIDYKGELILQFKEENRRLNVEILDNGMGIDKARTIDYKSHRSMSMKIFEERREILSKKMNNEITFSITDRSRIDSNTSGTLVKISILTK